MRKTILFYSPFNHRSRDTESIMIALKNLGHRIISLSQENGKDIHELLQHYGIETHTHVLPGRKNTWYFFRQMLFFIRFCFRHKIDVAFSHLEPANYVASLAQFFVRARVILCRHHVDEASLYGFDKSLYYKVTYALAKEIIVVSDRARHYMIDNENVRASKIKLVNLAYDFSLYNKPNIENSLAIRQTYSPDVLLLTVSRLTKYKRPDVSIRTIKLLADQGINAHLIILGKGEMKRVLESQIRALNIEERVHLLGHVPNVLDYMQACDFLVHPSLLESSCVVIKEAGLSNKPVIVCEGVGDFDAYIKNDFNGFIIPSAYFEDRAAEIIGQTFRDRQRLEIIGENLNGDVHRLFDVSKVINNYVDILNQSL